MSDIDVAVVIVTYKSAALTINCLKTIEPERAAPGIRLNVIVVDNKSGDVPMIAKAIEENGWSSWVTVFEAPRNGGFAYGNNFGTQRAYDENPPDYVHYLNPDTLVRKGGITALVSFLEAHPNVGIAVSHFHNSDGSDWPYVFRFPSLLSEIEAGVATRPVTWLLRKWAVLKQVEPIAQEIDWGGGASMLVRREVLDAIGGFDQQFFLWREETDLSLRAKNAGYPTWYVPDSHIVHIGQQSTNAAKPDETPRRLPAYWFDSRNHYYAANHGVPYAITADVFAVVAHAIGHLKRLLLGRTRETVPYFLTDFFRNSIWWPEIRKRAVMREIARFSPSRKLESATRPAGVRPAQPNGSPSSAVKLKPERPRP